MTLLPRLLISTHQSILNSSMKSKSLKSNLASSVWNRFVTTSSKCEAKIKEGEDFWDKNKRFNRPMSPHLTIYKPQLTSLLSITHRGTGFFNSAVLSGFSIAMLALPDSWPHYLEMVSTMPYGPAMIFLTKFGLSFSFIFHVNNGIRHLFWDAGYGFGLRDLYRSGYFVVGISLIFSAILAFL